MSIERTWQITSTGPEHTSGIAEDIGRKLRGGETIELVSDLGGGKTTFTKGLARGIGSEEAVHSPSFTIGNQYQGSRLTLYHFDFYRLRESGIMRDELVEVMGGQEAVVAVEWGDIVEDVLPAERLRVSIRITGEDSRQFDFKYPDALAYLIPEEQKR